MIILFWIYVNSLDCNLLRIFPIILAFVVTSIIVKVISIVIFENLSNPSRKHFEVIVA